MSQTRANKRSYHHGNLKAALVDAALQLIAEEGLQNLSLREVARRAGVSTAAPYRHFPSREALLAAIALEGFRLLGESMRDAMAEVGSDAAARLVESGVGYVRFAVANPARYAVMFSADLADKRAYPELEAEASASFAVLLQGIVEAQQAGRVRAGVPQEHALVAWSSVHGLSSLVTSGQLGPARAGEAPDALARRVSMMLLAGLGPAVSA